MQSKAKPFDDLTNLMTNAAGALKGVGDEVKAMGRSRAESLIADMDLVGRDEFEVFKTLLADAQAEIAALKTEVKALKRATPKAKAMATTRRTAKKPAAKKTAAKKTATKTKATTKRKTTAKRKPAKKKA